MKNLSYHFMTKALSLVFLLFVFMGIEAQNPATDLTTKKSLKKVVKPEGKQEVSLNADFLQNWTANKEQVLVKKELTFKTLHFLPTKAKEQAEALKEVDKDLRISFSQKNNTPFFINGKNLHPVDLYKSDAPAKVEAAYDFMKTYKDLLQISNPLAEFKVKNIESDEVGKTHIRLLQQYQGVPVWGSDVIVHLDEKGVESFNGRYEASPKLESVNPNINPAMALETVEADLKTFTKIEVLSERAKELIHHEDQLVELVIYPHQQKHLLAWKVAYFASLSDRWEYFVDAQTGKVLHKFQHICKDGPTTGTGRDLHGVNRNLHTYQIGNTFLMLDAQRPMFNAAQSSLPDDPAGGILTLDLDDNPLGSINSQLGHVTSNNNNWNSQSTAISAHHNAALCYEYFLNTHSRNSLNGQGGTIISIVNIAESDGGGMDNAFWNGQFYGLWKRENCLCGSFGKILGCSRA